MLRLSRRSTLRVQSQLLMITTSDREFAPVSTRDPVIANRYLPSPKNEFG
jgi:hypothetical protein